MRPSVGQSPCVVCEIAAIGRRGGARGLWEATIDLRFVAYPTAQGARHWWHRGGR